jgi:pyruvate formate lyase activating enzyme
MPFHKLTFNRKLAFATLHSYGCTFQCPICSYKLKSGASGKPGLSFPKPEKFLKIEEIKKALEELNIEKLFFMGGEPAIAPELPELLFFAKNRLGLKTSLGHTNGSRLPLPLLDSANVGLKAWDEQTHLNYTGVKKEIIFSNFEKAFATGTTLKANMVLVPGLVELPQIRKTAEWLSSLSPEIPFHVMAYIPVPGQKFRRPTLEETLEAVTACGKYLNNVNYSYLSPEDALNISKRDERFKTETILPVKNIE